MNRDEVTEQERAKKQAKVASLIRDMIGIGAFGAFCFGVWLVYGVGWACIIGGAALFGLTILGMLRRPTT